MPNAQYEEISEAVLKTSGAKRAYILENRAHKKPKVASIGPKYPTELCVVQRMYAPQIAIKPPRISKTERDVKRAKCLEMAALSPTTPSPFHHLICLSLAIPVYEDVHGQTPELIPATPPSPPRISFPAAAQSSLSVSPDSMEVEDEELEDVKDCTPTLVPTRPLLTPSPGLPRYSPPRPFSAVAYRVSPGDQPEVFLVKEEGGSGTQATIPP
ncbi:hypothetical protein B0H17DRAFT_1214328 [Mycena rosella]|uniref:Uncharacterized protein n=1 Tax=Mycena rosella TaxID=1033263 RepID=A0AAD7G4K8_MYCRO|nr:hypothetical protein B0H17DRAFT_1214328 [Mycena rosella]